MSHSMPTKVTPGDGPDGAKPLHWNHSDHWFYTAAMIFLLACVLRWGFAVGLIVWQKYYPPASLPALPVNIDGYEMIAENLRQGNGFSSGFVGKTRQEFSPNVFRTPAYPIFLLGVKWVFHQLGDPRAYTGGRSAIFFFHGILGGLTAAMVFGLARHFWGMRTGLWAGVFAACDPISVLWAVYPRAEVLLTTFTVAGFWLLVAGAERLRDRNGRPRIAYSFLAGAGLAFSLAALTKPIALYLIFAVLPLLVWICWSAKNWRGVLTGAGFMLATWVLLCGGWMWRNYIVTREACGKGIVFFSAISSENLLAYRAAHIWALAQHQPLDVAMATLRNQCHDATGSPTRTIEHANPFLVADMQRYDTEAWKIIRAHPFLLVRVQMQGMVRLLFGPGELATLTLFGVGLPSNSLSILEQRGMDWSRIADKANGEALTDYKGTRVAVWVVSWGWLLFLYPMALAGSWKLWRTRRWISWAIPMCGILYYAGLAGGPEANSRFRVPLIPFVAMLAGCGMTRRSLDTTLPLQ